jgi:hypothetical protein
MRYTQNFAACAKECCVSEADNPKDGFVRIV